MQRELSSGLSAAEAAVAAISSVTDEEPSEDAASSTIERLRGEFADALDAFDDAAAQTSLDRLFGAFSVESVLRDVILPYLHELGLRWAAGDVNVGQEHFASHLIRGRLLGLARGWDQGGGPRAVLACPPGELHDLGLMSFGLALYRQGWRITFLGSDTPINTIEGAARTLPADMIVISATEPRYFSASAEALVKLTRTAPLGVAGAGASSQIANQIGGHYLGEDPVAAARRISHRALDSSQ